MFAVERLTHFDFLSAEYHQLFDHSTATLFQNPVWLDSFYSTLVPTVGAEPLVVTVRTDDDGRLLAVLPLVRTGRGLTAGRTTRSGRSGSS